MTYRIEVQLGDTWYPVSGLTGGRDYVRGYLDAIESSADPRPAYRMVDGKGVVRRVIEERATLSLGMVVGIDHRDQLARAVRSGLDQLARDPRWRRDRPEVGARVAEVAAAFAEVFPG